MRRATCHFGFRVYAPAFVVFHDILSNDVFDRGYIQLGRYRGAPIRLHWTVAIGMLYVSGLRFAPGAWAGYLLLILLHELGHAFLVRRYGLPIDEVMVHGLGGHCRYGSRGVLFEDSVIATGGVVVQLLLLAIALPIYFFVPVTGELASFLYVMTVSNALLIAINLIPVHPLDGHLIAKLPGLYARARRRRAVRVAEEKQRTDLMNRTRNQGVIEPIDERAVKDLVKKALDDAKRAAKQRSS